MCHIRFEHIKGTANILVDHIPQLRFVGLYKVLALEGQEKEFRYLMFDELPPISAKQNDLNASKNQVQHITI